MLRFILLLLVVSLLKPAETRALELEVITAEKSQQLTSLFSQSRNPTPLELLKKESWTCKIHGMRSRIQVHQRSDFYKFFQLPTSELINSGAQDVSVYDYKDSALVGKSKNLTDIIRITPTGKLIAELSTTESSTLSKSIFGDITPARGDKNSVVIAYTTCK